VICRAGELPSVATFQMCVRASFLSCLVDPLPHAVNHRLAIGEIVAPESP
jgi:hypothetical protein